MNAILDGPRRHPAAGGPATHLVILLHGLGADGADLIELAGPLGGVLPGAAFAAPNAPQRCELAPWGYQWFGLTQLSPAGLETGADRAAPPLMAFIEAELAAHGLGAGRLALIGFSQGTMMALHVGLRMAPAPAAIIGFSGLLVAPGRLPAERRGVPPVLLVHGDADPVVPYPMLDAAADGLARAGISAELVRRPGLGHGIDEPGLRAAAGFLRRHLDGLG
jgi:phospholipase/carboxylesterase